MDKPPNNPSNPLATEPSVERSTYKIVEHEKNIIYRTYKRYLMNVGVPEVYCKFGFYSLIAACLQCRYWTNIGGRITYPNIYALL